MSQTLNRLIAGCNDCSISQGLPEDVVFGSPPIFMMDPQHKERIRKNLKLLISNVANLDSLFAELLHNKIIYPNHVEMLNTKYATKDEKALEFFLLIMKRGPDAFPSLINALHRIGNRSEANILASGFYPSIDHQHGDQSDQGAVGCIASGKDLARPHSATMTPQSSPVNLRDRAYSTGIIGQLRKTRTITMESLPPLDIKNQLQNSTLYNMGVHEAYRMISNPRGYVLIINNLDFIGNPAASRTGAEKDTENLRQLFESLHFIVISYHNVKKKDLFAPNHGIIDSFLAKFGNEDCCIVAVMSHGGEGYFLSADAEHINNSNNRVSVWKELLPRFNNRHCPKLRNKPKIFIIQSCRGEIRDRGVRRNQTDYTERRSPTCKKKEVQQLNMALGLDGQDSQEENDAESPENDRVPSFEDMIICQSTVPGFVSNRDIEKGTWYIESLCRVLTYHAHEMELIKMLKKVGLLMRSISSEYGEKQMCSYLDAGFHYELYFNPGLLAGDNDEIED